MIPVSHLQTQALFEQLQRELDKERLRAAHTQHHQRQHLRGRLGSQLMALGTGACEAEQRIAASRGGWGARRAANTSFCEQANIRARAACIE